MTETQRVGEVIEARTTDFVAQCYELYRLPPLGSLVKIPNAESETYGIICNATTASIESGRRPVARGRDAESEEAVYRASPQLNKLLRSEFCALVVGHRSDGKLFQYLPAGPARIHGFVYLCTPQEVREFSQSLGFLNILINARVPVAVEELTAAAIRRLSQVQDDPRAFLVGAGKELAILLSGDFNRLKAVLERIKP